jgi:NAD(P)-dependent dehydrogenase (short-subunit alcohol dehydrogenase family)
MEFMKGKRIIITGPTSGIGKEIAIGLSALGAEIVLGCRDVRLGRELTEEITRRTGSKSIAVMHIDTSNQQSVRDFARQYHQAYPSLDVLINNAGLNRATRQISVDGIELTFATNVLGYYLLTHELLNLLKSSAPARIVNVASTFASDLDLDDLQFKRRPYDGVKAYAQSKACDRLLTWAFARRLEKSSVAVNTMAPGLVPETGLYRDTPEPMRLMLKQRGGRSAAEGADTAVWLASSREVEGVSGKFFEQRREILCAFRNTEVEEKLWGICERLVGST